MEETNMSDYNKAIIEEFRANGGIVGGHFQGRDLILLNTIGAKSGLLRVIPVVYMTDGDRYVIIASNGGSPTHPDWYYNIVTHPEFDVEVGTEKFTVKATVVEEPQRTRLYDKMAARYAFFAEYRENTERVIPLIILSRLA
jgi:deazaflavin-dependent oxidoreductase (nitroreductase family)